jgi:hypothetical protein
MLCDSVHHREELVGSEVFQLAGTARARSPARTAALTENVFHDHYVPFLVHLSCVVRASSDAQTTAAAQLFIDRGDDWF